MLESIIFAAILFALLAGVAATTTSSYDHIDPSLWRHIHH
jgi:hypothetical protein